MGESTGRWRHRYPRRPSATGRMGPLFALTGVALATVILLSHPTSTPTTVADQLPQQLTLTNDAGASALFQAHDLSPGQSVVNCVQVSYRGARPEADLGFHIELTDGGLAQYLHLSIEVGENGHPSNCSGFVPEHTAYEGTLADFADGHSDAASALKVRQITDDGEVSFRFLLSVTGSNAAQAKQAGVTFVWTATAPDSDPTPTATATPTSPTTTPATTPTSTAPTHTPTPSHSTSTAQPEPTVTATATQPVTVPTSPNPPDTPQPSPSDTPQPSVTDSRSATAPDSPGTSGPSSGAGEAAGRGGGGAGGGSWRSSISSLVAAAKQRVLQVLRDVAAFADKAVAVAVVPAARVGAVGLSMYFVVLLFLLVQDQIDRRDPKLALAPLRKRADREFLDRSEVRL